MLESLQDGQRPVLLTLRETAAELRLSERSIANLIADGRLPSIKIGRSRRIRRVDLDRLIADGAEGGAV